MKKENPDLYKRGNFAIFFNRTSSSLIEDSYSHGPPQVTSIVAYSKGFACACGPGIVYLYEKTDDKDFFKKAREIRVRKIIKLLKSPSGKTEFKNERK